jgi:hypothetical protein
LKYNYRPLAVSADDHPRRGFGPDLGFAPSPLCAEHEFLGEDPHSRSIREKISMDLLEPVASDKVLTNSSRSIGIGDVKSLVSDPRISRVIAHKVASKSIVLWIRRRG